MNSRPSHVEELIHARIQATGPITFADFMRLALYHPQGYYSSGTALGADGDFYTSPLAHPLFGALLTVQLEQMWRLMETPARFDIVELGAGTGQLAADILSYVRAYSPEFATAIRYRAIEHRPPSKHDAAVEWLALQGVPNIVAGCILSNEFFDALPTHVVELRPEGLREVYVTSRDGRLFERLGPLSDQRLQTRLETWNTRLHVGWRAELCLEAEEWMERIGRSLERGYVLTVDYGDEASSLFTPARSRGTLTSFHRHAQLSDPLARPGRQDITAHVNFSALIEAGSRAGLQPVTLMAQSLFLKELGAEHFFEALRAHKLELAVHDANLLAMRELLRPDGLGAFRILVQAKGAPLADLACLGRNPALTAAHATQIRTAGLPLFTPSHVSLARGGQPHAAL